MAIKKWRPGKKVSRLQQNKLSNKQQSKLGKQGKLKKFKRQAKIKQLKKDNKGSNVQQPSDHSASDSEKDDHDDRVLDIEDLKYYGTPGKNVNFATSISQSSDQPVRKRKTVSDDSDEEASFEKIPRRFAGSHIDPGTLKHLLPIKHKGRVIPQTALIAPESAESDIDDEVEAQQAVTTEDKETTSASVRPMTVAQLYAQRQKKVLEYKERIALISTSILADPQNMKRLKELRIMLEDTDEDVFVTVRKLVMVSLMELFKDLIPAYRIRLFTDTEKLQKMKKDTKLLHESEEALVKNYRAYLEFLERAVKGLTKPYKPKKARYSKVLDIPAEAAKSLSLLAVRCLCVLLSSHPHFNYRTNIISLLIPRMIYRKTQPSDLICECVKKVFRQDKNGDVSLEIVYLITRTLKHNGFKVHPKVLLTFLALKIREIKTDDGPDQLEIEKKRREHEYMSRREKKIKKQKRELEKELMETKAEDVKQKRLKVHTDIIQSVFLTYFRILKTAQKSILLPAVLEGLARFSHLINLEFFDDLFSVFNELIESEVLSYRESLHCVQTAFTILSGQGSSLTIDPLKFYRHLYRNLFHVHIGKSDADVPIILICLDVMLNKRRKQVTLQRAVAFIKRLSTLSLQLSSHSSLATLAAVRTFIHAYPRSDVLYDNENQGSGMFLPEVDDPEYCNAQNTALWELTLLQRHYRPCVVQMSRHLCKQAPVTGEGHLSQNLNRKTPKELYREFDPAAMMFDDSIPAKTKLQSKKRGKRKDDSWVQDDLKQYVERVMSSVPDHFTQPMIRDQT